MIQKYKLDNPFVFVLYCVVFFCGYLLTDAVFGTTTTTYQVDVIAVVKDEGDSRKDFTIIFALPDSSVKMVEASEAQFLLIRKGDCLIITQRIGTFTNFPYKQTIERCPN